MSSLDPHLNAVLNTGQQRTPEDLHAELLDLVMMVGNSAWSNKDLVAAKKAYNLALKLQPPKVEALNRLGRIALLQGDLQQASNLFLLAADRGNEAASWVNLAIAYGRMKTFGTALSCCSAALQLDAAFLPAYIQKAAIYDETGDLQAAERAVLAGLDRHPGNPDLLYALSLYQLKRGDFDHGWENYECREPRLDLTAKLDEYPEWNGEPLEGKTILVCGEQGIGDQLMFARYVPLLKALGATIVLFTRPELARLFATAFQNVRILTSDAELKGLEPDYWIAMASLPRQWAPQPVSMPEIEGTHLPYLWADGADISRFFILMPRTGNLRVGLCWRGNPKHRRDEYRSIQFENLKPLLEVSGVDFYSLQQGDKDSGLMNLTEYCHDLADTAAAIASLDLVITVDTAMLHLAGAMDMPVWGLMWTPGDWRWGSAGGATPWYRSAILFRQRGRLSWAQEIRDLRSRLTATNRTVTITWYGASQPRGSPYEPALGISSIVTRECRYGNMFWPENDTYVGRSLDLYGEYSEAEAKLLRKLLKPGDVAVEAGAHVGALTLPMAQAVGPTGAVLAFEPQPLYFRCLRDNHSAWRVSSICWALGAESKRVALQAVEEAKVHAPGWPSGGAPIDVEQRTIDSMDINGCDLIKIDVDGQELEILRGAEKTIARFRPLIYVENDRPERYPDLLPWLDSHGYRLYQHLAPLYNPDNYRGNKVNVFGSLVSAMLLAVPKERKDLHPVDWGLTRVKLEKINDA